MRDLLRVFAAGEASDIAGEIAAALAHAALVFKTENPDLAAVYYARAKATWALTGAATNTFTASSDTYPVLQGYYESTAPTSHVFFAAASLFAAATEFEPETAGPWRASALQLGAKAEPDGSRKWFWSVPSWNNAWWDAAVLMAALGEAGPQTGSEPLFTGSLATFVDSWVNGLAPVQCVPSPAFWVLRRPNSSLSNWRVSTLWLGQRTSSMCALQQRQSMCASGDSSAPFKWQEIFVQHGFLETANAACAGCHRAVSGGCKSGAATESRRLAQPCSSSGLTFPLPCKPAM